MGGVIARLLAQHPRRTDAEAARGDDGALRAGARPRDLLRALQGLVRRQVDVDAARPDAAADRGRRRRLREREGGAHRAARAVSALYFLDGLVGIVTHVQGVRKRPGGFREAHYNLVMGPPLLAPGLALPRRRARARRGDRQARAVMPRRRPSAPEPARSAAAAQGHDAADGRPLSRLRRALADADHWDEVTRRVVLDRVENVPPIRFFTADEAATLKAFCDIVTAQDDEPRIPVLSYIDEKLAAGRRATAGSTSTCPTTTRLASDRARARRGGASGRFASFDGAPLEVQVDDRAPLLEGRRCTAACGTTMNVAQAFKVVMRYVAQAFYSHPWAWNEIGFGGPAYPRGYAAFGSPHLGERETLGERGGRALDPVARHAEARDCRLKGSLAMPRDNDSPFLLAPAQARPAEPRPDGALPRRGRRRPRDRRRRRRRRRARAAAGAQGLAGRRAREGAVLGPGPRLGERRERRRPGLYWTDKRIVSGNDPIEMGKNNSGVGVGGSMTHFAGYVPRLHPSDFEVRTRDGVAVDWPISYGDLKSSFERSSASCRSRASTGRGATRTTTRTARTRSRARRSVAWEGARNYGIEMRVGPVAITNGVFGNRPHCIYRGFCLEGCKVNAKASPLITHLPDAIEHGCEMRAGLHGHAGRDRRRDRSRDAASRTSPTASSASSARRRSPSAATRSRRRGCSSTRRRRDIRTGSGTTTTRSAAT